MSYNSSSIDASEAKRILDNSIDIINDMIREQKNFKREINELILNWRGGGRGKNSSLLISLLNKKENFPIRFILKHINDDIIISVLFVKENFIPTMNRIMMKGTMLITSMKRSKM